eukprot:c8685_g1_i1.p1 GENE.c8685_g1_i1~~c8685_g1_i1.p1  ORF type:complete len:457 (+),score=88.25 c8685_g1_i1:24-1373(+)
MECPSCGADAVIQDDMMASLLCLECGVVVSDRPLSSALQISHNSDGCAEVSGQFVPHHGFHTAGFADESINASLQATILRRQRLARHQVNMICSRLGLGGQGYCDMVCDLMAQITRQRWGSGRWMELLAGGCAYVVARQHNKPVTFLDIADAVSVNVFVVGRIITKLQRYLHCELPALDPAMHLSRACSRLTIPPEQLPKIVDVASRLLDLAHTDWLTVGRRPSGIIAGALSLACEILLPPNTVTSAALAGVCGVSRATTRQRVSEIKAILVRLGQHLPWGDSLTVKNVLQHTLDILAFKDALRETHSKPVKDEESDGAERAELPPSLRRSLDERQRKIDRFERAAERINTVLDTETDKPEEGDQEHDLEMEKLVLRGTRLSDLLGESQTESTVNDEEEISDSEIEGYLKTEREVTAMASVLGFQTDENVGGKRKRVAGAPAPNKRVRL